MVGGFTPESALGDQFPNEVTVRFDPARMTVATCERTELTATSRF